MTIPDPAAAAVQIVASQPWCAVVAIVAMVGGFGFAGYATLTMVAVLSEHTRLLSSIAADITAMRATKERPVSLKKEIGL